MSNITFFVCSAELILIIYKTVILPYPAGNIASEVRVQYCIEQCCQITEFFNSYRAVSNEGLNFAMFTTILPKTQYY
jgi:hypothetical protein